MIELLFVTIGVMLGMFVIVGGVFWSWGFITSAFDGAFMQFESDTASPFTFSRPEAEDKRDTWFDDEPEKLREH